MSPVMPPVAHVAPMAEASAAPPPPSDVISPNSAAAIHCAIPDIAMATSSFDQLTLQDHHRQQQPTLQMPHNLPVPQPPSDLQLDLGDGRDPSNSTVYL